MRFALLQSRQYGWCSAIGASLGLALFSVVLIASPQEAEAQLRVSSIDWVQGRPEIPHPAMNGRSTILQAVAEGGNCGGNYSYRWDINGDGDFDDGNEGWRGTNSGGHRQGRWAPLGLEITFPNQPGDRVFYPKVEVDCAGTRQSVVVPYLVRVDRICPNYPNDFNGGCTGEENIELTRSYYHDRIVDRALWWMFNNTTHYSDDGVRGTHACVYWGSPGMYAQGHMLNAFLRRSHGYGPGRDSDVYYRHQTRCGLSALMGTYAMTTGSWFDDDAAVGWNGWRMSYRSARLGGHWGWGSYGSTAWVEPMVNYGTTEYRAPGGEGNINNRTLRDIAGDLRDGVMYCMGGSGQWFYSCRSDGHPDQSTNGWAPESMRLLGRKFDINTYDWARDRQRGFVHGCCSHNNNNDHRLFGCSYHPEWSYAGGVGKLAGNALVSYGWTQYQNFEDNRGDTAWRMREHWRAATRLNHNWWGLYYMYATTKGMRSFVPEINRFEDGRDWATHFAHFLVTHMRDDSWWRWCSNNNEYTCHWHWRNSFNPHTSTAIATQIVQTWLEAQALARATPQSTGPGIPVTFDHSWSHILDPLTSLTRFRWNVDGVDGWDFTTDRVDETFEYTFSANLGWDDVISRRVVLEVTDSQGRTVYDDKSVQITLSLKNHKPVVVAHPSGRDGIYSGYFGQSFALDASRSYETDQCVRNPDDPNHPGGSITIVDPPTINDVPIQDCNALEDRMNTCLDNADPTDVDALLGCVDLQFALQDCRALDTALLTCGGILQVANTCNGRRGAGPVGGQLMPEAARSEGYGAVILDQQPSAYWALDDSRDQAVDQSENEVHASYQGNVELERDGYVGAAIHPNGDGFVATPVNATTMFQSGSSGSVTAIIRTPDQYAEAGGTHALGDTVWTTRAYYQGVSVGTVNGISGVHFWGHYTGTDRYQVSIAVPTDTWVHTAWVMRDGQFCGYANGAERCVEAADPLSMADSMTLRIGRQDYDGANQPSYRGDIQHVATFPAPLTEAEVRAQVDAMVTGTRVTSCTVEDTALGRCQNETVDEFNTSLRAQKIAEFVQENGGTMPTEYNPPVQNGLVGYWPLDGTAEDVSTNGLDGNPEGTTRFSEGRKGAAVEINSDGDGVRVIDSGNSPLDIGGSITMSAWIKPYSCDMNGTTGIIMNKENRYEWGLEDGTCALRGAGDACWRWWGSATVPPRQWTHVAISWDGARERHYINGELVESEPCSGATEVDNADFKIGARGGDGANGSRFNGLIDEGMLFNRTLSDAEIQTIYQDGLPAQEDNAGDGATAGNCGGRELFPGQGNRPRGIPDKITSICFDTNFNNNWCEAGEIQYLWPDGAAAPTFNDPVAFVPRAGMGEGDIIGVPVRVCDDGRWNGKCYQPGDGGPGNLTRADCSECGYGTASIQVVTNQDPPELRLVEPEAEPAKTRLNLTGVPADNDFFDLENQQGDKTRFVFDHETTDVGMVPPTTTMAVTNTPMDGETFRLRDHTGNERRFVFRNESELTDGTTSDVLGIPHIQIGLAGVTGNLPGVSDRMTTTINGTGALDITAQTVNEGVKLTQGSTSYSGNTAIESSGINGVTTPPFVGGAKVGIQDITNDLEAIADRVSEAVTNHFHSSPRDGDNTLGHWGFNEGQGNTTGDRLGRNGNTLSLANGTGWTADGVAGSALLFDGNDDFAYTDNRAGTSWSNEYSLSMWVKTDRGGRISSESNPGPNGCSRSKVDILDDGRVEFYFYDNSNNPGERIVTSQSRIIDNQWHHVVTQVSNDLGRARLFIDGRLEGEIDTVGDENSYSRLWIGGTHGGCVGNRVLRGAIDEVRLYNRRLTEVEVKSQYEAISKGSNGASILVTQATPGFSGNTPVDMSNVSNMTAKDFSGGRPRGYEVAAGESITLDLSNSRDPEGVLGTALETNGIYYRYEIVGAGAYVLPTKGFEGQANGNPNSNNAEEWPNWGPKPIVVPRGDGPRNFQVRARARDVGGREQVEDIDITLVNEKPRMGELRSEVFARAPSIDQDEGANVASLGNRRYRVVVQAVPDTGVDTALFWSAREKYGQPITVTGDMDGDGNNDVDPVQDNDGVASGRFNLTFRDMPPEGRTVNARVEVTDGNDSDTKILKIFVPAISEEAAQNIRYTIDVGNDGSYELINSRRNNVDFVLPAGANVISIAGAVEANGQRVPFDLGEVSMPNVAPRFSNPRIVRQDSFDVVVAASARDQDGDPVTITVDWGDGNVTRGRNVIYSHSYANARFQAYTIVLRATDDRGAFDEARLAVDIVRPAIQEADVSGLTWQRLTEIEGRYDGVRAFDIDPAGTLFSHNYMDIVRRSTDGGDNWQDLLRDVECCGSIATKNAGEVYVASPAGLYFSGDNGDNWELYDEDKYLGVMVSPDQQYIVASTKDEAKRFDVTGRLIDRWRITGEFEDMESCAGAATRRSGLTNRIGQLYINDRGDLDPAGWRIPADRFGKNKGVSSVSFDKNCNLYHGVWNGYRILKADNSIVPDSIKVPKHLYHVAGSHTKNVYGGCGEINDILAWPDSAVVVGAERGMWGENEPRNAYRNPYWKQRNQGLDRSRTVRKVQMHPTNGYAYAATSSAVQMPKYCRRARRNNGGRRNRGRRGRTNFYYVFCGFTQNYFGGVYRSANPLLLSRTVGEGGSGFDNRYARGLIFDGHAGGLVIANNDQQPTYLWLVDTAASTMTKWEPSGAQPRKLSEYRVGLPQGECPGSCCHSDGCNMPSRVAVDSKGDVYVASRGFGMQGTVTKVAGAMEDCIDRNNNGRIDTSRNGEPMDYGADECILWTVPVGPSGALLRAMTVDLGDEAQPNGYIWVGSYNRSEVYKLHPEDGRVLATLNVGINTYGMTVVANGDMYVSTLGDGALVQVNTQTNQVGQRLANPVDLRGGAGGPGGGRGSYGITTDTFGRVWQNSWGDNMDAFAYDPADGSWCRITFPTPPGARGMGRGITTDPTGRIWTAIGGSGGTAYLAWIDPNLCQPGQSVAIPDENIIPAENGMVSPTAIGADARGNIWLASYGVERMVKVEPDMNFRVTAFDNGALVYSYSDFTGVVRRMAIGQGSYEHDFEADCDQPVWTALDWEARTPPGASVSFSVQTAARRNKLHEGRAVNTGRTPGDEGPINIGGRLNNANVASRRFLRLKANLTLGDNGRSPVLSTFTVRWNCE